MTKKSQEPTDFEGDDQGVPRADGGTGAAIGDVYKCTKNGGRHTPQRYERPKGPASIKCADCSVPLGHEV